MYFLDYIMIYLQTGVPIITIPYGVQLASGNLKFHSSTGHRVYTHSVCYICFFLKVVSSEKGGKKIVIHFHSNSISKTP